ncbi:hypothetical protein IW152_002915 [Coemansia sp. BCRC 34962]|nr:hypothetical protein IW152_002915 [Coemansia sp. BCRC 34962]
MATTGFAAGAEVDAAICRLRRKLRRFTLHPRTPGKLEAMWTLYEGIKRSSEWRINDEELAQFLRAIQRVGGSGGDGGGGGGGGGGGVAWQARAEQLAGEAARLGSAAAMALLRVHAKYGDTRKFEAAAGAARRTLGAGWAAAHGDYGATRAIAYARAGLPAQALRMLGAAGGSGGSGDASQAVALQEVAVAWARARCVDGAWAAVARLQAGGARVGRRAWNAVLHMHAVDERYRMELVEEVFARMGGAGDAATYNILMHAALLRGRQARWRHWLQRMEAAGLAPDAFTHTALASALAGAGRWADAARVIRHMRGAGAAPTRATAVAAMQMQRRRGRAVVAMARFRQAAAQAAPIGAHEFTQVAAEALADPRAWVAEIALLVRCLEERRVAPSPAVDALAARLPGLSARARAARPLLAALSADPARAGRALAAGLAEHALEDRAEDRGLEGHGLEGHGLEGHGLEDRTHKDRGLEDHAQSGRGPEGHAQSGRGLEGHTSYAATVGAVVRCLLRSGRLREAELVVHSARRAHVFVEAAHARGSDALAALVAAHVAAGRLAEAAALRGRLERLVEAAPSARAFGALLRLASAGRDVAQVEAVWRRMADAGVGADAVCHRARIACLAAAGCLLSTRRAYTDMLDDGHAPHAAAVAAVVRRCVRAANVALAVTVVRHAERHGCLVSPGTYNLIMSRCVPMPAQHRRIDAMFAAMLRTPDTRLCRAPGDVAGDVDRLRKDFADLSMVPAGGRPRKLEDWLVPDDRGWEHTRRALVAWLTSQAAYPAAPSLSDPGVRKLGAPESKPEPAPAPPAALSPPPPNATTFIIVMRFYGQNRRWSDVLRAWHSIAELNSRIAALAAAHPFAENYRVAPFSRMVGWAARALLESGRPLEAQALWQSAGRDGTLSENARVLGMEVMTQRLKIQEEK